MVCFALFSTIGYFNYFRLCHLSKIVESLSVQNATICYLFESLHNNYENKNSMRYKSFKFDVNSVYESKKIIPFDDFLSYELKMLIHFNSMRYKFNL